MVSQVPIINTWAQNTVNKSTFDETEIGLGIEYGSPMVSDQVNGLGSYTWEAIQFLQRTGSLYNSTIPYIYPNIASLIVCTAGTFRIHSYLRTANNPGDTTNNPPITGASISTVSGIDIYSSGTPNSDWQMLDIDWTNASENLITSGSGTFAGLNNSSELIQAVADPVNDQDAATKKYVDTAVQEVIYVPDSLTLNTGTYVSGDVDSVKVVSDGNYYIVDEVSGVPGYDIEFDFIDVQSFSRLWLHVHYAGLISHVVNVNLWNYNTLSYDTITTFTTSNDFQFIEIIVNDESYIDESGNSKLQIYHVSSGLPTHTIEVDYVALAKVGFGSSNDHGALRGLSDLDHPASAIINTPAGNISATTVQDAIDELDTEKEPVLSKGDITTSSAAINLGGSPTNAVIGGGVSVDLDDTEIDHDQLKNVHQDVNTAASPTFAGITIVNAINEFSTDGTMAGDSDSAVPTEKAVKAYVDNNIGAAGSDTQVQYNNSGSLAGTDKIIVGSNIDITSQLSISGASRIRATRDSTQTIANTTYTIVQFDDEEYDNLGEYDNATNYRFTAAEAGYYFVNASIGFDSSAWDSPDNIYLRVYKNGIVDRVIGFLAFSGNATTLVVVAGSTQIYLDATEYIDIRVYHNRGSNTNIRADADNNFFEVHRLS